MNFNAWLSVGRMLEALDGFLAANGEGDWIDVAICAKSAYFRAHTSADNEHDKDMAHRAYKRIETAIIERG
jgi:hypothetical protein